MARAMCLCMHESMPMLSAVGNNTVFFLRSHAIDSVLVMPCGEEGRSFFDLALVGEVLHLQLHGFARPVCFLLEKGGCAELVG